MKYIKRIILENFQSHKYSVIDLDESLNVILGPSDSGKSAIIRGIKWALYNEPSGDYFIREGEKHCSVTLEFNDGTKVTRYRSKSKNTYILIDRLGEELKFEGFGTTVPEEITDIIGIKKINLDSEESNAINLGEQLEGPFLLSEKNATRASAIGRLVGVNVIDDALKETLKDIRGLNIYKRSLVDNTTNLEQEIKSYDYIDNLKLNLNLISDIRSKIKNLSKNLDIFKESQTKLNNISKEINDFTNITNKLKNIDRVSIFITNIDSRRLKYKYLSNYNSNLLRVRDTLVNNKAIATKLKGIDEVHSIVLELNKHYSTHKTLVSLNNKYLNLEKEKNELEITKFKLKNLSNIDTSIKSLVIKNQKLTYFNSINLKFISINSSLNKGVKYLDRLSGISKSSIISDNINKKIDILSNLNKIYNNLLINREELQKEHLNLTSINASIEGQLRSYQELLKEVEICPFCMSSINDDKIKHIIDHYIGG